MNRNKRLSGTIFIFIFSIVALVLSFVLYIYWYIEISSGLHEIIRKFDIDPRQVFESQTVLVIVVLSLLVGLILAGLSMTFVYNLKMHQLYRLQNNFINNFTHELKTPVTSLKLYLETFLKHELNQEDQQKYINYMLQDVHRLSDNISNILDLGRVESRNFQGEFSVVDVASFVASFYSRNAYLFQNGTVHVESAVHAETTTSDSLPVALNQSLFEMLLINLTTNALKYNESDNPALSIRFEKYGQKVKIMFSDNGIGIDPLQSKHIFKKFYQAGDADTRSAQGSGLGLYLVQNIVRAHRGKIKVNSKGAKKGATFLVTLPLARKNSTPIASSENA